MYKEQFLPSINDIPTPIKTKNVPIAVAVALWSGGNHVLDMRAGAANATEPDIPFDTEVIPANLQIDNNEWKRHYHYLHYTIAFSMKFLNNLFLFLVITVF